MPFVNACSQPSRGNFKTTRNINTLDQSVTHSVKLRGGVSVPDAHARAPRRGHRLRTSSLAMQDSLDYLHWPRHACLLALSLPVCSWGEAVECASGTPSCPLDCSPPLLASMPLPRGRLVEKLPWRFDCTGSAAACLRSARRTASTTEGCSIGMARS